MYSAKQDNLFLAFKELILCKLLRKQILKKKVFLLQVSSSTCAAKRLGPRPPRDKHDIYQLLNNQKCYLYTNTSGGIYG